MSSVSGTNRRRSSQRTHDDALDGSASLSLSRTKSPELTVDVAERIAIQDLDDDSSGDDGEDEEAPKSWPKSTRYLVLLCAFLTSLSFGVTQVPILYVFRLMTCDAYYQDHPSQGTNPTAGSGGSVFLHILASALQQDMKSSTLGDRCSIHAIESSTALSVALLGASTTVFGVLNLFITSSLIKRIGVKPTLLIQGFFPAVRLFVQNVGVEVWGKTGIIIVQLSQIITIIGGPSGYLLVLNSFVTEVVDYEERTGVLGQLTGAQLAGSAFGFLIGGYVAEWFGIKAPFRMTLVLFLISCAYVLVFLPHIPPAEKKAVVAGDRKKKTFSRFFGPLAVFAPRKFIGPDEVVRREYGAFLLAWGVFLGILATGYLPTLLQLYSTDVFDFGTKANGWLIFMFSILRGMFLTFVFPKLIAIGRRITTKREEDALSGPHVNGSNPDERQPLLETQPPQEAAKVRDTDIAKQEKKQQTYTFDLTYTRFSLIADGLLTMLCMFVKDGWQLYLVAAVLPFAAGTGAAAKGTILQMVGSSASSGERTDALAGVSLVENMARLSTTFVFGVVFAGFAGIGRAELTFTVNAAVALIGFGVLLFARFPIKGSRRLEGEEEVPDHLS